MDEVLHTQRDKDPQLQEGDRQEYRVPLGKGCLFHLFLADSEIGTYRKIPKFDRFWNFDTIFR